MVLVAIAGRANSPLHPSIHTHARRLPLLPQVGEHTRPWENGRVLVCDTSFFHETHNGTARDRVVLIMRHWHPEVNAVERAATQFIFDCVDSPTAEGIAAAQRKAAARVARGAPGARKSGGKKKGKAARGGGGFGKPAA